MLKSTKIKLNEKEYILKQSFRSLLMFEEMTGKNITNINDSLTDTLKLFYCMLKASNEFDYTYDQFVDIVDSNENSVDSFTNYLIELNSDNNSVDKKKVKKS